VLVSSHVSNRWVPLCRAGLSFYFPQRSLRENRESHSFETGPEGLSSSSSCQRTASVASPRLGSSDQLALAPPQSSRLPCSTLQDPQGTPATDSQLRESEASFGRASLRDPSGAVCYAGAPNPNERLPVEHSVCGEIPWFNKDGLRSMVEEELKK
jgi:hypothetical protein